MDERARMIRILDELNLPKGQWTLSGSGIMVMHNIERDKPMGDIDIFVSTRLFFDLLGINTVDIGTNRTVRATHDPRTSKWEVYSTDPLDPKRRADPPYLAREMYGIEVNIFSDWRRRGVGDLDVNFLVHNAKPVDGIPCYPLQILLDWKEELGRAKDVDDIRVLKEHLS
jgi:hypothetical protein